MKPLKNNENDLALLGEALEGNKQSLERLIKNHQDFVYNVALRLYLNPDDALDATQEVLIKVITHLKSFNGKSEFRTWLYRIVVNHFLNAPKRKFEALSPLEPVLSEEENLFSEEEIEEARILCSTAMLMCLNREQRLIFIMGEIFEADHQLGAELFDITPANFRVKLHRAKVDLQTFVAGKCGLVNPANPCRCPKKTKQMVGLGLVDKENLKFNAHFTNKVSDWVSENSKNISDTVQYRLKALFSDSPYQIRAELDSLVGEVVR
jgi:RNA polymerase sigma factor (sigma-70 family)